MFTLTMCHISHIMCHMTGVKCQVWGVIFCLHIAVVYLVGKGYVINGALSPLSSFVRKHQHRLCHPSILTHNTTSVSLTHNCFLALSCDAPESTQKSLIPMKKLNETYYKIHFLKYRNFQTWNKSYSLEEAPPGFKLSQQFFCDG